MCTFCELPLNEHAVAVAHFISDKSDYDDSYCADTDQYGWCDRQGNGRTNLRRQKYGRIQ